MPKTKAQKHQMVSDMSVKLGRAKTLVFTDYKGMTMPQLQDLRAKLKEQGAEFSVTKNTLLSIALKENNKELKDDAVLSGPVATLFAYEDEILPIKTLVKALKDNNIGKVKAGFFESDYLDTASVNRLAALPGKQELQGQLVGVLAAPIKGIVTVLHANIRGLAVVLDQIRIQKGGESA